MNCQIVIYLIISTTSDGNTIIICCEGEPNDNEAEYPLNNPPGSIAIIDVSSDNINEWEYFNLDFSEFNEGGLKEDLLPIDIYLPYTDNSSDISLAIEPDYSIIDNNDK